MSGSRSSITGGVAAVLLLLSSLGCAEEAGVWIEFSQDDETPLSELSQAQLDLMVEEMETGARQLIVPSDLCMFFAVSLMWMGEEPDADKCRADFEKCLDDGTMEYNLPDDGWFRTWWFNGCTGTVYDLELCVNDSVSELADAYNRLHCEASLELLEAAKDPADPQTCISLTEDCGFSTGNDTSPDVTVGIAVDREAADH